MIGVHAGGSIAGVAHKQPFGDFTLVKFVGLPVSQYIPLANIAIDTAIPPCAEARRPEPTTGSILVKLSLKPLTDATRPPSPRSKSLLATLLIFTDARPASRVKPARRVRLLVKFAQRKNPIAYPTFPCLFAHTEVDFALLYQHETSF